MNKPKEFWIKNMVCNRCLKVIKQELQELEVTVLSLELGRLLVEAPKKPAMKLSKLLQLCFTLMILKLYKKKKKCSQKESRLF